MQKTVLLALTFLTAGIPGMAHIAVPDTGTAPSLGFIENKGQWTEAAKYKADIPGGAVFITDRGFVYNYCSEQDLARIHEEADEGKDISGAIVHHHAYKVVFSGANPGIRYSTDLKRPDYHNYFIGNDPSKWAANVSLFGRVVQRQVYDGIDVAVYSKGASLKYDFIVAAGADAGRIALAFEGVTPQLTPEGHLKIRTSVNEVTEQAPYAYQVIAGRETPVPCHYRLAGGRLTFDLPAGYDRQYPLVIDPQLIFATYSGGTGVGTGFYSFTTTYDAFGNLYAGCQAYQAGWPTTTGAFQAAFAGNQDVGVNKYNATGTTLIYSTYYGGSSVDLPHAMYVNDRNELIVAGSTSSFNLPHSTGCLDSTLNGGIDIFIAHFNSTGTVLLGGTYIGGSNGNDINGIDLTNPNTSTLTAQNTMSPVELTCDAAGNIWVVSNTAATDFPVTGNALQGARAGNIDGVLFQLTPNCAQLLYSTYIGGSGNDALYGLVFDRTGNLVLSGGTLSNDFPVTAGVLHATSPGGGGTWDGFVAVVNPGAGTLLRATYLGTTAADIAVSIQTDAGNNYYVLGRTLGAYPISQGVYNIGNGDVFIDKLTADLTTSLASTRIGNPQSGGRYAPTAFLVDICDQVYVAGLGAVAGLPVTPDAFSTNGQLKFWFCALEPNFTGLVFATYFGTSADHTHVGVSRLDPQGIVYHSLCSNATNFPTTPGVWGPARTQTGGQDIVSFKFSFDASGVRASYVLDGVPDSGCAPFTVPFLNTSTMAESFIWDFGNGTYSTQTSPTYTFTDAGTYVVKLYAKNDTACITDDTFQRVITVLPMPEISVSPDITTCVNNPVQLQATPIYDPGVSATLAWTPSTYLSNSTIANPVASPVSDITYHARVTLAGGCYAEDSLHITVLQGFELYNQDTAICKGDTVLVRAGGDPRYTYTWRPADGVSNTGIIAPRIVTDTSRTYTVTAAYPGCRDSVRSFAIDVQPVPVVDLGDDQILCYGDTFRLRPVIDPDYYPLYTYTWNPGGGLNPGPSVADPLFTAYTTTTLTLTVSTPAGCLGSDDILLNVVSPDIISASPDTAICPGDTITLHVWGTQVSQLWRPAYYIDDTLSTDPNVYPVASVAYIVYGRDVNNCLDTQVVRVRVLPEAVVALPDSARIYPGESYQMDPGGNCLYFSWFPPLGLTDPDIMNPVATPDVNTRYFATGRTEYGCTARDSIDLYVNLDSEIDMPNAFAPGSGPNNTLRPVHRGRVTLRSFSVYNRWGGKLYETTDVDAGWDGSYKGQPQPMGVYVYVVEAVTPAGRVFHKQGNVTLLR